MNPTDRKITIMFLETSLRIGGTENILTLLMERLDPKRTQPILACLYEPGILGDRLIESGHRVYHGLARNRWDFTLPFRLIRLLRKEKVDVLFMVNQPLIQFWGTWCALLAGVKVRITAIRSTGKINRIQRRLWINQLTFPWVTRVTALSRMHRSYLIEQEKINERQIEIIPNGVDLARFKPQNGSLASLRGSFGIPEGAPVVGIVAMLRPEKGHTVFIQAASEVLKKAPPTFFVIVGEGPERPKLEALAKELGIESQIRFLGARRDISELLHLFDVAVLSSHAVVETVSNSVLEYMASAKPVVATRVGSLEEMVDEGKTGFIVEPGDPKQMAERIAFLVSDLKAALRMGKAGREKVEREYSIDQMLQKTTALFENLVAQKGGFS